MPWINQKGKMNYNPKKVWLAIFALHWLIYKASVHILWHANLFKSQACQIPAGMGGFTPNPSMLAQAPGGYPPAPQPGGYGAPFANQQSYGLYPQPQGPGMGYPGQPMPGYPRAPSPNPQMAGFGSAPSPNAPMAGGYGGGPAPMQGYPQVPSPNPSMPAYGGGGAMPVAPAINVI